MRMRKKCGMGLLALLFGLLLPFPVYALQPDAIASASAVLMDADTGQVLYDKNSQGLAYPASTTKIMTALLVCENCSPDEILTVSRSAVDIDEWDSANIALIPGEQMTVGDALYGLMLPSANDAANTLAEHVAGSQARFVEMMNQRAWQLGARNTRFANAHGLHDPMHYTTAFDMALITQYAAQNPLFMQYFGAASHTIPGTNLQPIPRRFTNYQSMLVPNTVYYDPAVLGGKVGYTDEAQHTMSTIAQKNSRTLICVVMKSTNRGEKFTDTAALLRYGFEDFHRITLSSGLFSADAVPIGDGQVKFHSDRDFSCLLRNDLRMDDIQVELDLPDGFQKRDRLPTSVRITIPTEDSSLPSLLGYQPLVSDMTLDSALLLRNQSPQPGDAGLPTGWFSETRLLMLGVGISIAALTTVVGVKHHNLQKQHRQRLEEINRRISNGYKPSKSA